MGINIGQILAVGHAVAGLFPVIDGVVKGIEDALPTGTSGSVKLEAARQTLSGVFSIASEIGVTFETAWPAIASVISALVGAYNAIGLFKKAAAAA